MEQILQEILDRLRSGRTIDARTLEKLIRAHNRGRAAGMQISKRALLDYVRSHDDESDPVYRALGLDADLMSSLNAALQLKPRRTSSGVATVTVLMKPWPCGNDCLYCPSDVRMPRSYLHDEPACQRAERNLFDPYLQVAARLKALETMGHPTDKIELIVLGGTFDEYPRPHRIWFVTEMFRALNDDEETRVQTARKRMALYSSLGIRTLDEDDPDRIEEISRTQSRVTAGVVGYNEAIRLLYLENPSWSRVSLWQVADIGDLERAQVVNETASHRVVGLVFETRPDTLTVDNLTFMRRLGCTKVQMGVQSLDGSLLKASDRAGDAAGVSRAFSLLRSFGFKVHVHFMVNLPGSDPVSDIRDYRRLFEDPAFRPDEVKIYPCVLVECSRLHRYLMQDDGSTGGRGDGDRRDVAGTDEATASPWTPYSEEDLIEVLTADMEATPPYARVSRMIRDISAHDIVAGNKRANLRQLVEGSAKARDISFTEMRSREIAGDIPDLDDLVMDDIVYRTADTTEHFLQWIMPDNRIVGFLRLSLPDDGDSRDSAMIREVHVYGQASHIDGMDGSTQHRGLGKQLVAKARELAADAGYHRLDVISAVGTRGYYRTLGFHDDGLYQGMDLD